MFRFLRLFLTCCLLTFLILPAASALAQEDGDYTRSAFSFADKKQWVDAQVNAENSNNEALKILINWQYLLDPDSGASFSEIIQFVSRYPDWPEQKRLRIRGEMSLADSGLSADEIIDWFDKTPPLTGIGKIALADALKKTGKGSPEKISMLVHLAWRDGDFTEDQERAFLLNYGHMLKPEDDVARTDRLVWEGKSVAAERMMPRVSEAKRKLYKARMALQSGKKDAQTQVVKLPASVKNDVGLLYDLTAPRSRSARRRPLLDGRHRPRPGIAVPGRQDGQRRRPGKCLLRTGHSLSPNPQWHRHAPPRLRVGIGDRTAHRPALAERHQHLDRRAVRLDLWRGQRMAHTRYPRHGSAGRP